MVPFPVKATGILSSPHRRCPVRSARISSIGVAGCRSGVEWQVGLDLAARPSLCLTAYPGLMRSVTMLEAVPGDGCPDRDVAQPRARVVGDAQQHPGMAGQEAPVRHVPAAYYFISRNILLVTGCEHSVKATLWGR